MFRIMAVTLVLAVLGSSGAEGCGTQSFLFSSDVAERNQAIESHRKMGPVGLQMALRYFDSKEANLKQATDDKKIELLQEELDRFRAAIDQIAGQRNAVESRLFWYTDLEKAKAAAAESGKPILSLRMLGKLTDEYSCANSRFFRTTLYANAKISDAMRERFVLHWQSVRPVPKVTIDFGDGRTLCRTITGNSAHYVLSAEGRPLDVLPGLYSPQAFLGWLHVVEGLHGHFRDVEPDHAKRYLAMVHAEKLVSVAMRLSSDLRKLGRLDAMKDALAEVRESKPGFGGGGYGGEVATPPTAWEAEPFAVTKGKTEVPILKLVKLGGQHIDDGIDDKLWKQIAALHRKEVKLDGGSVALIRREHPDAEEAGAISLAKAFVEDPILRLVRNFEDSIGLDTVRNEYLLHRRVHQWFARGDATDDFDALNERVYTELFLTPSSDPWLGLAPAGGYTALDGAGLSVVEPR